jgi:hypothetical protein
MNIDNFIKRLDKTRQTQKGFDYILGKQLRVEDFENIEKKLQLKIPARIRDFYLVANGLITINPDFELIEPDNWKPEKGFIHFATFNKTNNVYFYVIKPNNAKEWTIIDKDTKFEITLTISSFWSNKLWHWIERKKNIWADNWWIS